MPARARCMWSQPGGVRQICSEQLLMGFVSVQTALAAGADVVVQSSHKTLSALTQAAMLHVRGAAVDRGRISRALQMLQVSMYCCGLHTVMPCNLFWYTTHLRRPNVSCRVLLVAARVCTILSFAWRVLHSSQDLTARSSRHDAVIQRMLQGSCTKLHCC